MNASLESTFHVLYLTRQWKHAYLSSLWNITHSHFSCNVEKLRNTFCFEVLYQIANWNLLNILFKFAFWRIRTHFQSGECVHVSVPSTGHGGHGPVDRVAI